MNSVRPAPRLWRDRAADPCGQTLMDEPPSPATKPPHLIPEGARRYSQVFVYAARPLATVAELTVRRAGVDGGVPAANVVGQRTTGRTAVCADAGELRLAHQTTTLPRIASVFSSLAGMGVTISLGKDENRAALNVRGAGALLGCAGKPWFARSPTRGRDDLAREDSRSTARNCSAQFSRVGPNSGRSGRAPASCRWSGASRRHRAGSPGAPGSCHTRRVRPFSRLGSLREVP